MMDDVEIVFTTTESKNAIALLDAYKPNLTFLDVDMPYVSGIDLILPLPTIPFSIVFAPAHHQYAIQAFRLNALDYLLKPVSYDDVEICLNKYRGNELKIIQAQMRINKPILVVMGKPREKIKN